MADRRGALVPLLIFCWIVFSPSARHVPVGAYDGRRIDDVVASERHALAVVQNSTWQRGFGSHEEALNLTGLEPDRGYAWSSFPQIQQRARDLLEYSLGEWGVQALDTPAEAPESKPLYTNITGHVRGHWQRSKLQAEIVPPHLNLSKYMFTSPFGPQEPTWFQRNITGDGGEVAIRLNEDHTGRKLYTNISDNITEMSITLKMSDPVSLGEWEMKLRGVHFVDVGQAILTTTSDKFAGIFMLPHFALSQRLFDDARTLLNQSISRTIQRQVSGKVESFNPWGATSDGNGEMFTEPDCDMIVYLQQMQPVFSNTHYSSGLLSFFEHELRFPTGAIIPRAPDMHFSMVAFSPDCGFVLESKGPPDVARSDDNHMIGPKMEVEFRNGRHHLLVFTLTLALQLFLLMRQMHEASTPSTRSRISFYSIAMLALGDGFTTMSFLIISLFVGGLWINLVATGFLAFVNVSFFGMRFLMDIWTVQMPERTRRARERIEEHRRRWEEFSRGMRQRAAEAAAANAISEAPIAPAEPAPEEVTAPPPPAPPSPPPSAAAPVLPTATRPGRLMMDTGASPLFIPSDQETIEPVTTTDNVPTAQALAEAHVPTFASLYTRFYFLLLALLFTSLYASSWPAPLARTYFTLLALAYLSFWTPQIHRNVQRNCRHALKWEFVVGQSVLRLVPFFYFYGYRANILFADPDWWGLAALCVWVWVQVVLLVSQNLIGPRWFWLGTAPPAFDYHPVLREDEEGAMLPIGFAQAAADDTTAPSTPVLERRASAFTAKETRSRGKRVFDCAICMQDLEVTVVEAGASAPNDMLGGGLLARRAYMVTPCRHIFHSACLEGWMKYRLQCPICRETLPPL